MGSDHDKLADLVVWDKDDATAAYIIVECKKLEKGPTLHRLKAVDSTCD